MFHGSTEYAKPNRLAFIDSLRGIAVLFVVLWHTVVLPSTIVKLPDSVFKFAMSGDGSTGVIIFFIISAFSLCYTMPMSTSGQVDVRKFYTRRLFRIAPLFYILLIVTIAQNNLFAFSFRFVRDFLWNVSFLFNLSPGHQFGIVGASWTIGVEMLFYFVFPLLYVISRKTPNIVVMLFLSLIISSAFKAILSAFGVVETFFTFSLIHNLPLFLFGVVAYNLYVHLDKINLSPAWAAAMTVGAVYGYFAIQSGKFNNIIFADDFPWKGILGVLIIIGLAVNPLKIFVNSVTQYIGKISYSVYLLHVFVINSLFPFYKWVYETHIGATLPISVAEIFAYLVSAMVTIVISVAVASLSYRYIELPGIRLGRSLLQRSQYQVAVQTSPAGTAQKVERSSALLMRQPEDVVGGSCSE
ncbi:acyltransferase [Telmatospirillum sp.]|uniref:acyltransferase family protein n=1 Tax=Telmatospirillum sp. TaxID=2079197 RepID=UPI002848519C|nr:acyltransferase [Telmatospirillum sp.]MDR3439131.1 acyltransferase [Telmatospirillum sp.]